MRRNCPHCGVDQVVADEKLTTGWIFLKCHQCAAVSPVQGRAAFNLSQAAEKSLRSPRLKQDAKVEFLPDSKPEFKPELILESKPEVTAELTPKLAKEITPEVKNNEPRLEITASALKLPPVPEFLKPESSKIIETSKLVSAPQQPQNSQQPQHSQFNDGPTVFESDAETTGPVPILLEEEKAPHERLEAAFLFAQKLKGGVGEKFAQFRPYALPVALAVVCFGSGSYLIRSARLLRQGSWVFSSPTSALVASDVAPVLDSVAQSEPSAPQAVSATSQHEAAATSAANRAPASAKNEAPASLQVSSGQISSGQTSSGPAVAKARRSATDPKNEQKVEVLANNAVLRAGPGTHYNKVGTARAELQLLVKGQFDNWIEVRTGSGNKTAWIRNDLVKPLKEVAQQEAQP